MKLIKALGWLVGIVFIPVIISILYFYMFEAYESDIYKSEYKPTITHPVSSKKFERTSLVDACKIEGDCLENVVLFQGYISGKSATDFFKFMQAHPEVKIVCLNSVGGETEAALKMSKLIADRGLVTCMADYYKVDESKSTVLAGSKCSSSCNMLLLSSKKRILNGVDVFFKGHGFANTRVASFSLLIFGNWYVANSYIAEPEDFASALNYANTPDKEEHFNYIKLVKDISHLDSMKTLSSSELIKYRIFTHRMVDNALVKF